MIENYLLRIDRISKKSIAYPDALIFALKSVEILFNSSIEYYPFFEEESLQSTSLIKMHNECKFLRQIIEKKSH